MEWASVTASAFASLLRARRIGRGKWVAKCPAHPDKRPSLSISEGKRTPLVFRCMSHGCTQGEVLAAMGIKWGDVLGERETNPEVLRQIHVVEARRLAQKEERTRLLYLARERIQFWHRKSQVYGRSVANGGRQVQTFHHALDMERRCQQIWEML